MDSHGKDVRMPLMKRENDFPIARVTSGDLLRRIIILEVTYLTWCTL